MKIINGTCDQCSNKGNVVQMREGTRYLNTCLSCLRAAVQMLEQAQERQALNAWIAEHMYHLPVYYDDTAEKMVICRTPPIIVTGDYLEIPDYAGDWAYAGPLFDRYHDEGLYLRPFDDEWAVCLLEDDSLLARMPTGPEAIAKACKAWEEVKDDNRCKHEHINEYHECVMCGEVQ